MKSLHLILLCLFFFNPHFSFSQPVNVKNDSAINRNWIDSIKQLLAGVPEDTTMVIRLIEISRLQYDPENMKINFASKALSLAEKIHFKNGIILANQEMGSVYQRLKDYKTSISYYQKAIALSDADGYISDNIGFYSALLNLYFYLGDYPNAMETISREMLIAEKLKDKKRIAHCNNILGYIYFKQENFNEAEKYYDRYIHNAKELNDHALLVHALGEIADLYIREGKYKESTDVLFAVISICDSLLIDTRPKGTDLVLSKMPQYKAKAFYRLAKTYKLSGNLSKALQYSLESINLSTEIGFSKYDIASYYINAGDIYKELKDYKKAIAHLAYGFNLSKEIQHRENTRDAAEILSQIYAAQHQYDSAFYFYQLFTGLKDSIVNNETKMKIAGIQGQYDVAKKDKEIARQQQIRNIIIGSFVFLLVVLLLAYNGYRLKQKNKYQQELNRQQNELFNVIVSTQDQERKRIAQDIHDSLGSVLSAAKLKLSSLEESKKLLSADQLEKYQTSMDLLDEASAELRNISHNIMPATLSKLGLVAALQSLIEKISAHSGIQISFTAHDLQDRLEETTEISIYRIILELINNIVKHAAADKATIQLIKFPTYINISVEDNGAGFNFEKAIFENKGIGLGNILSRVEYLKGTVEIDSSPGKGTTVIIEIPYNT